MKSTAIIFIILTSFVAMASDSAHGSGSSHIPLDKIGWQAANLGLLLVGIFFFIRKSIVEAFADRQKTYLEQFEKTKSALKDAEAALAGIKEKLSSLEGGEKKSLENAQHEASLLRTQIIRDAEAAAEKMKKDTELIINNEISKAKAAINQAILTQALTTATKGLSSDKGPGGPAQEAAFVKQLEQVRA